eukprot:gene10789-12763_t
MEFIQDTVSGLWSVISAQTDDDSSEPELLSPYDDALLEKDFYERDDFLALANMFQDALSLKTAIHELLWNRVLELEDRLEPCWNDAPRTKATEAGDGVKDPSASPVEGENLELGSAGSNALARESFHLEKQNFRRRAMSLGFQTDSVARRRSVATSAPGTHAAHDLGPRSSPVSQDRIVVAEASGRFTGERLPEAASSASSSGRDRHSEPLATAQVSGLVAAQIPPELPKRIRHSVQRRASLGSSGLTSDSSSEDLRSLQELAQFEAFSNMAVSAAQSFHVDLLKKDNAAKAAALAQLQDTGLPPASSSSAAMASAEPGLQGPTGWSSLNDGALDGVADLMMKLQEANRQAERETAMRLAAEQREAMVLKELAQAQGELFQMSDRALEMKRDHSVQLASLTDHLQGIKTQMRSEELKRGDVDTDSSRLAPVVARLTEMRLKVTEEERSNEELEQAHRVNADKLAELHLQLQIAQDEAKGPSHLRKGQGASNTKDLRKHMSAAEKSAEEAKKELGDAREQLSIQKTIQEKLAAQYAGEVGKLREELQEAVLKLEVNEANEEKHLQRITALNCELELAKAEGTSPSRGALRSASGGSQPSSPVASYLAQLWPSGEVEAVPAGGRGWVSRLMDSGLTSVKRLAGEDGNVLPGPAREAARLLDKLVLQVGAARELAAGLQPRVGGDEAIEFGVLASALEDVEELAARALQMEPERVEELRQLQRQVAELQMKLGASRSHVQMATRHLEQLQQEAQERHRQGQTDQCALEANLGTPPPGQAPASHVQELEMRLQASQRQVVEERSAHVAIVTGLEEAARQAVALQLAVSSSAAVDSHWSVAEAAAAPEEDPGGRPLGEPDATLAQVTHLALQLEVARQGVQRHAAQQWERVTGLEVAVQSAENACTNATEQAEELADQLAAARQRVDDMERMETNHVARTTAGQEETAGHMTLEEVRTLLRREKEEHAQTQNALQEERRKSKWLREQQSVGNATSSEQQSAPGRKQERISVHMPVVLAGELEAMDAEALREKVEELQESVAASEGLGAMLEREVVE